MQISPFVSEMVRWGYGTLIRSHISAWVAACWGCALCKGCTYDKLHRRYIDAPMHIDTRCTVCAWWEIRTPKLILKCEKGKNKHTIQESLVSRLRSVNVLYARRELCVWGWSRGTQRSAILGFPSIYAYTLCRRTTKCDLVTHVGERRYLGVNHTHPMRPEFQGSLILEFSCIVCLHPLTQNDQIRHGNTYGEERVLGQPRHCICTNASRGLSTL